MMMMMINYHRALQMERDGLGCAVCRYWAFVSTGSARTDLVRSVSVLPDENVYSVQLMSGPLLLVSLRFNFNIDALYISSRFGCLTSLWQCLFSVVT